MKYTLELSFWGKSSCYDCMLSVIKKDKCICCALAMRPECPYVGCRSDCPLKPVKEDEKE